MKLAIKLAIKRISEFSLIFTYLISFIPFWIFVISDWTSSESFQIYIVLLISLIILMFIKFANIDKFANVFILIFLNLIFFIAPATVSYYFLNFRFSLKNISEYVKYIYEYNTRESNISWVGGPYLLNLICIILTLIYFFIKKKWLSRK